MILIGIDVGGTKCAVSLGRSDGGNIEICARESFKTSECSPTEALRRFTQMAFDLCDRCTVSMSDIYCIGVSCGGPLDAKHGVIMSPPNLPEWDDIHITEYISEHTGRPCILQNDANACALVEWLYGAGKGTDNMVFMTFGTGLGAGLILDGKLYSGTNDMAGEVGHVRAAPHGPVGYNKEGSYEGFCSGGGIAKLAQLMSYEEQYKTAAKALFEKAGGDADNINAKLIADMADDGDKFCKAVYARSGEYLGHLCAILADVLNPEVIVIGSIYTRSENLIRESMMNIIRQEALEQTRSVCRILPAQTGNSIGDYAALALAATYRQD